MRHHLVFHELLCRMLADRYCHVYLYLAEIQTAEYDDDLGARPVAGDPVGICTGSPETVRNRLKKKPIRKDHRFAQMGFFFDFYSSLERNNVGTVFSLYWVEMMPESLILE